MSFQQGLSGLNAASRNLDVIGNNVANANTVGAKASRAEFADIYATSLSGASSFATGIGVTVANIAQQFTQGDISNTNSALDLAVNGRGFFRMSNGGELSYTRNGQFQLDKDGFIVNAQGGRLTGYPADANGRINAGVPSELRLQTGDVSTLVWFAFAGAAVASVVVYLLGSIGRGGATPVRLALAGAALSALLFALTRAITLLDEATLDQFRFWAVGSLAGRDLEIANTVSRFILAGLALAGLVLRPLNALALGDDAAAGLGVRVGLTRLASGAAIVLLCGAAVAAVGPIGFIGLVVPHAVRAVMGPDQRWVFPGCALVGPALILGCDTIGRVIARPGEVQVGIMTAAIGGPAFVFLVRRVRMVSL